MPCLHFQFLYKYYIINTEIYTPKYYHFWVILITFKVKKKNKKNELNNTQDSIVEY